MNSKNPPLVSVVIPAFNAEPYIEEAIRSILDQTCEDWELIIIDDGSTDGTAAVIRSVISGAADRDIKFISRENRGVCRTLNEGLGLARGKYFSYLGADDVVDPRKLDVQIAELERTGFAAAFSDCIVIDAEGNRLSRYGEQFPYHGGDIYRDLIWCKFQPASPTNLFRRDVLESVGKFNEAQIWEDRDVWIRIAKDNQICYLDTPLAYYRVHGKNGSAQNLDRMYEYAYQVLDAAVERDPSLAASVPELKADIDAFQAGSYFEKLEMSQARRYAVKAILQRPLHRLAWRSLLFSLLGKGAVARIRKTMRERAAKRARAVVN